MSGEATVFVFLSRYRYPYRLFLIKDGASHVLFLSVSRASLVWSFAAVANVAEGNSDLRFIDRESSLDMSRYAFIIL